MKKAFITGITGQDGSYLAELLIEKGYEVHGLVRHLDILPQRNIAHLTAHLEKDLFLHQGVLENFEPVGTLVQKIEPDEVYHLASPSNVRLSLVDPAATVETIGLGVTLFLEAIRKMRTPAKFLNAASVEMFGPYQGAPQDEASPIHPITPYGAAKALAFQMTKIYRHVHQLPVCSAIPFNHESPRRRPEFVTRKVVQGTVRIKKGLEKELILNNLTAQRDWGWAPDYVEGMWRMLQQVEVDDYVLATGKTHSVEDLVRTAFDYVGLNWKDYVRCDAKLMPAVEISVSCGDATKAKQKLGWQSSVPFAEIVHRMIDAEMKAL